jgi:hypothetical protein
MIRYILTTTVANSAEGSPRIVLGKSELLVPVEQYLLDLGHAVVRTRVQNQNIWRALHHSGVIVLVETSDATLQRVGDDFTPSPLIADSTEAVIAALHLESSPPAEHL